jgi:hypothetical protein
MALAVVFATHNRKHESQTELVAKLAVLAEGDLSYDAAERVEVADALRRSLHKIGLRQGVMRAICVPLRARVLL